MTAPLAGLRTLDVSTLLAGTFLGDFGADVIKAEQRRGLRPRTPTPCSPRHASPANNWILLRKKGVI